MDEPTLGLDVKAARNVRTFIRRWIDERPERTLLLTTHYMAEADELCDRVAIINKGEVLACDSPTNLKHHLQSEAIYRLETSPINRTKIKTFQTLSGVKNVAHHTKDGLSILDLILEADQVLGALVNTMTTANIRILNLHKREPSLEDVFVHLVGQRIEEVERGR
jgi:ABC-2 type transport system ATP-binding protein